MSWGYFAELDLRLPAAALATLKKARPHDVTLPAGWSGLRDRKLEAAFGSRITKDETFAQTLKWYRGDGSKQHEETAGDRASLRVLTMLEKSILDQGYPLATLLFAAREHGGEGTLRFVNDGTSGGETGVELRLANGTITSRPLDDDWDLVGRLGEELYAEPAIPPGTALPINPLTGLPVDLDALRATLAGSQAKLAAQKNPAAPAVAIDPFRGTPLAPAKQSKAGAAEPAPKKAPAKKAAAEKATGAKKAPKRG